MRASTSDDKTRARSSDFEVAEVTVSELVEKLPDDFIVTYLDEEGGLVGLRWPYNCSGSDRFYRSAKRDGAAWNGAYWRFEAEGGASRVLDQIKKAQPTWPVFTESVSGDCHSGFEGISISTWDLRGGMATCVLTYPLPCYIGIRVLLNIKESAIFLIRSPRGKAKAALIVGPSSEIAAVCSSALERGASLSTCLATTFGLGPDRVPGRALVSVDGWTVRVDFDLHDPLHLLFRPKLSLERRSMDPDSKSRRWDGRLPTTLGRWSQLKAQLDSFGVACKGDDPEEALKRSMPVDVSSIGGWAHRAPNGGLLHEHQKVAIAFCTARDFRALIGDEMGTGKTAIAIACADAAKSEQIVVVCPLSTRLHWSNEVGGWSAAGGAIQHIRSSADVVDPEARWLIVTYDALTPRPMQWRLQDASEQAALLHALPGCAEQLRERRGGAFPKTVSVEEPGLAAPLFPDESRRREWEDRAAANGRAIRQLLSLKNFTLIVDEAHRIKNPAAKRTKSIGRLAEASRHCLLLTGTPLRNHEEEAATLLSVLDPRAKEQLQPSKGYTFQDVKDYLSFRMIRRTKHQVLPDLPAKVRQTLEVDDLDEEFLSQYHLTLDAALDAHAKAVAAGKSDSQAREALLGLLEKARLCLGLAKVAGGSVSDYVADVVEERGSCVVFTGHHAVSDTLLQQLKRLGISAAIVDGRTPERLRSSRIAEFQSSKTDVLVCGIAAAGEGISLTRSDTVVFAELDWVPAALLQAEDRIHRPGQERSCQIIHCVASTPGFNLDQIVVASLGRKMKRIGAMLDEGSANVVAEGESVRTLVAKALLDQR